MACKCKVCQREEEVLRNNYADSWIVISKDRYARMKTDHQAMERLRNGEVEVAIWLDWIWIWQKIEKSKDPAEAILSVKEGK